MTDNPDIDALRLAEQFHEIYERLAPSFGYETRKETRAFDPATPNGRLMVAVCGEILAALSPAARDEATPLRGVQVPREPTAAMVHAGTVVFMRERQKKIPKWEPEIASRFWRAMYDAALAERGKMMAESA